MRRRPVPNGPVHAPAPRRLVDVVELLLPVPPSVNRLHRHVPGRGPVRSDAYKAWINAAGWRLQAQRPGRVEGSYALTLALPMSTKADLGNLEKPVSDLLQAHGVIANDRRADDIQLRWQDTTDEVVVTVRRLDAGSGVLQRGPSPALPSGVLEVA